MSRPSTYINSNHYFPGSPTTQPTITTSTFYDPNLTKTTTTNTGTISHDVTTWWSSSPTGLWSPISTSLRGTDSWSTSSVSPLWSNSGTSSVASVLDDAYISIFPISLHAQLHASYGPYGPYAGGLHRSSTVLLPFLSSLSCTSSRASWRGM